MNFLQQAIFIILALNCIRKFRLKIEPTALWYPFSSSILYALARCRTFFRNLNSVPIFITKLYFWLKMRKCVFQTGRSRAGVSNTGRKIIRCHSTRPIEIESCVSARHKRDLVVGQNSTLQNGQPLLGTGMCSKNYVIII